MKGVLEGTYSCFVCFVYLCVPMMFHLSLIFTDYPV